ncbi:MAG: MCE family protein [Thermoleophilaceae bacterium]|nr:MCE family protein [Thermoleophilaceae bacterium]
MTRRRGAASIVASPVLVGAVTVLVAIIAVFIAYNANAGLPFVPTYDVKAELPSGAKLVAGNEVRVGGFRVGVVEEITTKQVTEENGQTKAVAVVDLKLDKVVEPLAKDSRITVRPRSALGLKYVEITPGRSKQSFAAGETVPAEQASEGEELEDVFSTFDTATRNNSRVVLEGFGDALAGRGQSINETIQALNPLLKSLTPVMKNLSNPRTELSGFFRNLGAVAAQVAPVAETQAQLFTNMADTFEAFSRNPQALQDTIEKSPPTLDVAISSFRAQRPFLANFADLSRRLRPAARELPRSLPVINDALRVGTPVQRRSVPLYERTEDVFAALIDLAENPNTLLAFRDITQAVKVARPFAEYVAPYQTVCNSLVYFFDPLGQHQSQTVTGGTFQNQGIKTPNPEQPNTPASTDAFRPADTPADEDPQEAELDPPLNEFGKPVTLHATPYPPAIDAQGNADCQNGQYGFLNGPLVPNGRYGPSNSFAEGGGNHVIAQSNFPFLSGPTFKNRAKAGQPGLLNTPTGPKNLKDVP